VLYFGNYGDWRRMERNLIKTIDKLEISDKNIEIIAKSLKKKFDLEEGKRKYASVREVLTILAKGTMLIFSFVTPGLTLGLKDFIKTEKYPDAKEWKTFNLSFLTRTIKRLEKQKLVEIVNQGKYQVVKITRKGKKRVLRYALDELELKKPERWDGRWYFVTYDIPKGKNWLRDLMRNFLARLGFYRFHESLYIHAYPCLGEIEFLREYLGVSEFVKVLVVNKIENDEVFRNYFGI